jgi:hypothetical protein
MVSQDQRVYQRSSSCLCFPFQGRGQILGRNPDESLKNFPPCYLQSPLQLCLEISFTSNSRNLLQIIQFSTIQLLYTVKDKGGNPNRNLKPENSQDCAQRPQRNCTFMNSASGFFERHCSTMVCTRLSYAR